jgi:Peptidase S46
MTVVKSLRIAADAFVSPQGLLMTNHRCVVESPDDLSAPQ